MDDHVIGEGAGARVDVVDQPPADAAGVEVRIAALEAERRLQRTCLEALEQGVVLSDLDGTILQSNAAAWRILGDDPATFSERVRLGTWDIFDEAGALIPLEDRPVIHTALTGQPVAEQVVYIVRDGGERVALRLSTDAVHDATGAVTGVVIAFADVSTERALDAARRHADEQVRTAMARLEAFLERSVDLICVHDRDGTVLYASPSAEAVLGRPLAAGDVLGFDRVHPDDRAAIEVTWQHLLGAAGRTVRVEVRTGDGAGDGWRHLELVATNRLDDPAIGGIVANVRDITERAEAAAQLTWQAFHDGLTGLPNRGLLMDRIGQALERTRRAGERLALLFVDLDRFKLVNDERGHEAGDQLLVEAATRLSRTVRAGDTVARLGGDEFVVVAEGGDETDVAGLADRIRAALEVPVVIDGASIALSASIGMAFDAGHPPERLLRDADAALYRAKARGRNRVEVFNEALRVAAQRRATVEATLRRVLDEARVVVHHQPIIDLLDGSVVGTEALVRIPAGPDRLEPPREYIAVAEDRGLIVPLGEAVLDRVGRALRTWRRDGGPGLVPFVAVNVSARQLGAPSYASRLAAALDRHDLRPRDIVLELTEDTVIGADRSTGRTVEALHEMGVRLWLDDFGTGYSSLAYLKRFPMDAVKLDRSFVRGLGVERSDTEIVRAVLALGESLGLTVVAEGVETPLQLETLREMGCRRAQGFALGAPVPLDELDPTPRRLDALAAQR